MLAAGLVVLESGLAADAAVGADHVPEPSPPASGLAQVRYEARFSLGFDKDAGEKVLRLVVRYRNLGSTPLTLSTYAHQPVVKSIRAAGLRSMPTSIACGRPAPPSASDVLHLAPGQIVERQSWYWADGTFPFTSAIRGDRHDLYLLSSGVNVHVTLCQPLFVDREQVAAFLQPNETLLSGTLCAAPVTFRYQVLTKEEP